MCICIHSFKEKNLLSKCSKVNIFYVSLSSLLMSHRDAPVSTHTKDAVSEASMEVMGSIVMALEARAGFYSRQWLMEKEVLIRLRGKSYFHCQGIFSFFLVSSSLTIYNQGNFSDDLF